MPPSSGSGPARSTVLDITDEPGIEAIFPGGEVFDHVVVNASGTKVAVVRTLPLADASMSSKFLGARRSAGAAKIADHGSLTLVSGFLSILPSKALPDRGRLTLWWRDPRGASRSSSRRFASTAPRRVWCGSSSTTVSTTSRARRCTRTS